MKIRNVITKEYEGVAVVVGPHCDWKDWIIIKMGFTYMKVYLTSSEWFNIYRGDKVRVTQWIEERKLLGLFKYKKRIQYTEKIK